MSGGRIFVGRKAELEQFRKVLEDPRGQAVLVVGQAGLGKSWLVDKMAELAENHPSLKCGCVRYEVTPTDSVDSTMALMMDNAFEAASTEPGSFDAMPQRRKQWLTLLKTFVPKGGELAELIGALKRDSAKNTREQFLERLQLISKRMPKNGRAIFVIDPEKYMQKDSDQSWAIFVKGLPDKIKLVFGQRTEDVLVGSETFGALNNVLRIPGKRLDVLEEKAVDELLDRRMEGLRYTVTEVRKILSRYKGHPYALQGALDLLKAGTRLEELPQDPTGIAAAQWKELRKRDKDTIRLFKTYAILEVGIPDEVVTAVSKLDIDTIQSVLADNFLVGLLREEGYGKRIYHAILADHIVAQMSDAEKKQYHSRAVALYREKLRDARDGQTAPDALAATRLGEHVFAAEGDEAFVLAFTNECYDPLIRLGLLDSAIALSERALGYIDKGSGEEAAILGNLGLIYLTRGDMAKAERMIIKALEIEEKLGRLEGMAIQYGNLGVIYRTRGDLDKAEQMHNKALEINEKLGRLEGMASDYGNLGLIYRERGDLVKAEQMHKKSLEIEEKLGRLEGMATDYGNLGLVYLTCGDLDKAEQMLTKSLEINQKLGRLEGMADHYGNLGVIYLTRGDMAKAEQILNKSLEINEKLRRLEGMASDYGNLGLIYSHRGSLAKAEQMYQKSLEIEEKVGRLRGMADTYGNLGVIYEQQGNTKKGRECMEKAIELYKQVGVQHMVEKVQGRLDKLKDK